MRNSFFALLFWWAAALSGTTYQLIELPALGGSSTVQTRAYGRNEGASGLEGPEFVAGTSGSRAVRWTVTTSGAGAPMDVGLLGSYTSATAYGVNNFGHVVGMMANEQQAFIWRSGTSPQLQAIPAVAPARCLVAYDINYADMVVGAYTKNGTFPRWAFSWTPAGSLTLYQGQRTGPIGSSAFAVSDGGIVVGEGEVNTSGSSVPNAQQVYGWPIPGLIGALPNPEGIGTGRALGINDHYQIVGESEGMAFIWNVSASESPTAPGGLLDLGPGAARDINNAGTIVGHAPNTSGGNFAFVKEPWDVRRDLNSLTAIPAGSGWYLSEARAINDKGWIAGIGCRLVGALRVTRAFVLIPQF